MAEIITTIGQRKAVTPANGSSFTLEEMQKAVGGLIECLYPPAENLIKHQFPEGSIMVLAEEGKILQYEFNRLATELVRGFIQKTDYIVGNVIICSAEEMGD